jgi:hypothetical protein
MKQFLFILTILISAQGFSQENPSVILMPKIMTKKEVRLIIQEKKNSELEKLVTRSKLFKNFQPVGFAAIPAGFLGAISLTGNAATDGRKFSSGNIKQTTGVTLLALGAICLTSSVYFNIQSAKNYKKAIQKYNQLYN